MKIFFWLFVIWALFSICGCTVYELERALPDELKNWYDLHSILMGTKVPWYVNVVGYDSSGNPLFSDKEITERLYFLKLPDELKFRYKEVFWKIRSPGLDDIFYSRVEMATSAFFSEGRIGWKTDRGQVLILVGAPLHVRFLYRPIIGVSPSVGNIDAQYVQIWQYYHHGSVVYTFCYSPPNSWYKCFAGNYLDEFSSQMNLERYWQDIFAPTESGWDKWISIFNEHNK